MKGIILAGGSGTRLHPITRGVSKQLLPIYDKPMIYYPLSVLMLAGIREILIITTPEDKGYFQRLLGDGSEFGIQLEYAEQPSPDGLAQAFIIGETFLNGEPSCLVLGDNIFFGQGFSPKLRHVAARTEGATVFGYQVMDPERFVGLETFKRNMSATCDELNAMPTADGYDKVYYPGELELITRETNTRDGIPVIDEVWETLNSLER